MSRWEPNARGRLEEAALDLYLERGFEQTTVAEIAARAGLTERTFFRHFADKREVLFYGSDGMRDLLVKTVADAPAERTPLDAVAGAFEAAGEILEERRERAVRRWAVITANPELQERELIKLNSWGGAVTEILGQRGVSDLAARLAAEAGIAVFRVGFERWIGDDGPGPRTFPEHIRAALAELRLVTAAG
jgi:AcrR family transcriptional regulator